MAGTLDFECDLLADCPPDVMDSGASSITLHFHWTGVRLDNPKLCIHEFNGTMSVVMLSNKHGIVKNIAVFGSKEAGERRMKKICSVLIDYPRVGSVDQAEDLAMAVAKQLGNKRVQAESVSRIRQLGKDVWKKPK